MNLKKISMQIGIYMAVIGAFVGLTYGGSRAVTAVSQMIPLERKHTIVIDAGHGGEDGGATSCSGILESRFNLEIARKLDDLLHLLGFDTHMIRKDDISVYTEGETIASKQISDLKNRVRIVNETENALLVSIHQNTYPDSRYSGAQVFFGPEGESQNLAKKMQEAFVATVNPGSNRKSKKADGVYLMEHINCTGVLVECGFLSNPEEETKLRSDTYQKKLCCIMASTLTRFLTEE